MTDLLKDEGRCVSVMSDQHLEKEGGEGKKEGRQMEEGEDEDGDENGGEGACFDC